MAKAYVLHLPGRPELHARKVLSIYVLPMAMAAHFHLCFTVPWLHGAICRRLPTCVVFLSRPLCLLGISSAHRLVIGQATESRKVSRSKSRKEQMC